MTLARASTKHRVGEIRPSQLLYAYGVGAIVDLPNISAMVMGLDDWDATSGREIGEERLLVAIRKDLGAQVERLLSPPEAVDSPRGFGEAFDASQYVGVPVAPFPRWVLCPFCRLLAPIQSGLFELKTDPFRADRARYIHGNCSKPGRPPNVLPARFLVACENGHLDDFPWVWFVHKGDTPCRSRLRLREFGISGEAIEIEVRCEVCGDHRRMSEAFGEEGRKAIPPCRGRRPHLRDFAEDPCTERMETILLGASNSWFPLLLSAMSVPTASNKLAQLVVDSWTILEKAASKDVLTAFRAIGQLRPFGAYADEEVWAAVEAKRARVESLVPSGNLKAPEWEVFSKPDPALNTRDFRLRVVAAPARFEASFEKIVLAERLREVRALVGFTRIESPGDFDEVAEISPERRAPLSRKAPRWVPAVEVRGEGIFIQLHEDAVESWLETTSVKERGRAFLEAHRRWRAARHLDPPEAGFAGMRYVLLHTLSHALMRQLALESGYAMAGIRERIYALPPTDDDGPMAGILLYTSAPDSEGTLGGLVSLGEPADLGRHLTQLLPRVALCASDPWCAEHHPFRDGTTLHGAACHACLFAPETSCERGNKYLDRTTISATMCLSDAAFFKALGK